MFLSANSNIYESSGSDFEQLTFYYGLYFIKYDQISSSIISLWEENG